MIYCATKHALSAIARGLRIELQGYGIKVTEIAPGMVDTDIRASSDHPRVLEAIKARKFEALTSEEVAEAVVYAAQRRPQLLPRSHRAAAARSRVIGSRISETHMAKTKAKTKPNGEDNGEAAAAADEDVRARRARPRSRAKPKRPKARPKQTIQRQPLPGGGLPGRWPADLRADTATSA